MSRRLLFLLLTSVVFALSCTSPLVLPDDGEEKADTTSVEPDGQGWEAVEIVSAGTRADPFSVREAQAAAPAEDVWVEGVIVGFVKGTSAPSSATFTLADKNAVNQSNLLISDTVTADYRRCIAIRLKSGSEERSELNLYDNPSVMHERLKVHGSLTKYLSIVGVKEVEEYVVGDDENKYGEEDKENGEEDKENDGGGNHSSSDTPFRPNSIDEPISVAEVVAYVDSMHTLQRVDQAYSDEAWVAGFIVGYYNKSPQFGKTSYETNVVLADSASVTDARRVLVVKLPKGEVRAAVNLSDNPDNLYRRLTIHGRICDEYGDLPSMDNVAESATYLNGSPTFRLWD